MQQLLAGEVPSSTKEIRYVRKDGSLVWVNLTWSLTRTSTGEPDYFIEVIEILPNEKRPRNSFDCSRAYSILSMKA